ncbi:MAG: hypothetical protein JSW36_01435 [Burkholderiales bacterium]|nr:MAG: hypothetical protein JSW36_01435 [Burkholderiales bacterium]
MRSEAVSDGEYGDSKNGCPGQGAERSPWTQQVEPCQDKQDQRRVLQERATNGGAGQAAGYDIGNWHSCGWTGTCAF